MNGSITLHSWNHFTRLALILAAALALRLLLVAGLYDEQLSRFDSGDYPLYAIGAADILQNGKFDNSLFLVRPPGFPLLIAALAVNKTAVLLMNVFLGGLIAPLSVMFASQCGLGGYAALAVGVIVAIDPASVVYSAFLGPEPLANLSLLVMLVTFCAGLASPTTYRSLLWMILAALGLLVSAYTRPASFLLWIVMTICGLWLFRQRWKVIIAFALMSGIGVGIWSVHNYQTFNTSTFSTIGGYNMLYYRAASVESIGSGATIENTYAELSRRVEAQLGHDTSTVDSGTRHSHYAATSNLQSAMQDVALGVFKQYPLVYLATIPIGLYRILLLLNFGPGWLQALFIGWNGLLLVGTLLGLWTLWRGQRYSVFWLLLLIGAYFVFGTLVVQTSGIDVRARTMLTPLMAVAVLYWLRKVWQNPRARRIFVQERSTTK